ARIKVGGVLLKARDKLGNNKNGVFQKWLASGRISKDDAYYYINLNISSRNLDNIKIDNFLNAPKTLQKEKMKKNETKKINNKIKRNKSKSVNMKKQKHKQKQNVKNANDWNEKMKNLLM